jgi:hypothetical protein
MLVGEGRGIMRATSVLGITVAVMALAVGGRYAWKHTPPFEQGVHANAVEPALVYADVTTVQTGSPHADAPRIAGCPVFPDDNVWNTPIASLPTDPRSSAYVQTIGADKKVHPDFGSDLRTGIPYTIIPPGTTPVKVTFEYHDDSDLANYPIPPDVPIEGGGLQPDGDNHVVVIDPRRCLLRELFAAHKQPDGSWKAGSGIRMDLTSNQLRAEGKTSADAAGLPIFPGLVRYDEVASGSINHALRFTIPHTQAAYIWPARHKASRDSNPNLPPMGQRFRLRPDFDISRYSKTNQVIMTALKRYGMFLADNGGAMFLSGVSDKRWDDDDLHRLGGMTAADFIAVDESEWQMMGDSGRVDPLSLKK